MKIKTSELIDPALDWAVAHCIGMTEPEPATAKWDDVKDLSVPFPLYEVVDIYDGGDFSRCEVRAITVTRCGVDESAGATAPSITFIDEDGSRARGSIRDYFLTRSAAEAEARITEAGGPYYEGYRPSTDWSQGGPIIERDWITIRKDDCSQDWLASSFGADDSEREYDCGPTPLVAGMRCFVASRLGDEVDVPDELLK